MLRPRRWLLVLLLFALALLAYLVVDGPLPRFGSAGATHEGLRVTGKDAPAAPEPREGGAPSPDEDATAGRRERLRFLVESGDFATARDLARAMHDLPGSVDQEAAAEWLGPKGRIAEALRQSLDATIATAGITAAEARLDELRAAGHADFLIDAGLLAAADPGNIERALAALVTRIEPGLPLDLGPDERIERLEAATCILRRRGPSGGFTHHVVLVDDIAPLRLRDALRARFGEAAVSELAAFYRAGGHLLRARCVLAPRAAKAGGDPVFDSDGR